jgi:hypothetical protein
MFFSGQISKSLDIYLLNISSDIVGFFNYKEVDNSCPGNKRNLILHKCFFFLSVHDQQKLRHPFFLLLQNCDDTFTRTNVLKALDDMSEDMFKR